jgi:uncharacterized protein YbjT (DUF2867 family)
MIVVTGATGNVGRPLVSALVEAGEQVTAVSRHDGPGGVRHVRADLTDPPSLVPALAGATAVFLLTSGEFHAGGDLGKVVDLLRDKGIRRVVLLSSQGVGSGRHSPALEEAVTGSGLDWTVLRAGGFHSNALQWAPSVRAARTVAAPFPDVALPTVDPVDLADVAAHVLRTSGHGGRVYELNGPAPITPREQAAAIGEALGEPVRFVELTRAEAKAALLAYMPEPVAEATLGALGSPVPVERRVSADVPRILGRSARGFGEWAKRNVAAFQ